MVVVSGGSGRVLLCYRAGRGMVVASRIGIEVHEVNNGRYRLTRFYPAANVLRVDLERGLIYLRGTEGPSVESLPCRTVEGVGIASEELPTL